MAKDQRAELKGIRTFPQLVRFLRDEMGWPIEGGDFEELTFEYTAEELGIDAKNAAKIEEIKRLRPLSASQPWGVFFVKFEPKRLPVLALRRILSHVVLKKRTTGKAADRAAWAVDDLLFVSSYGEGDDRRICLAHFTEDKEMGDLAALNVLGWDGQDTGLHLDDVADMLTRHLAWPKDDGDKDAWREQWRSAFELRHREVIATSKALAIRLAVLARSIRVKVNAALAIESERGKLRRLMKAFQEALIHDLDDDGFADMYAQTIAYGLLSARVSRQSGALVADDAALIIPVTNPFLRELMETFLHLGGRRRGSDGAGLDFDEVGINEVVETLRVAKMEAVLRDFGDRNPQEDPVIHFYELFLKEYDPKMRARRGVFYTPRPVVSYIVRSVDELLRTEFGLEDGLADIATWAEMARRHNDLHIPDGTPQDQAFVQILDPACGTGTFLVEVIDVIYRTMSDKWRAQGQGEKKIEAVWNEYVPKHLLPRLHGYELLMAPYAIAHLKIGLKLFETGYGFASDERARIYLTNSLEPAGDEQLRLDILPALAHEAEAVNEIKRNQRFTVVIGNPPYSIQSQNLDDVARRWADRYRYVDGELIREKGALQFEKALQDDCIKFSSLSQEQVEKSGIGIVGMIMSHSFIDNPTLRGMRHSLMQSFGSISVVDLHGNLTRKEHCPDGSEDKNVFDIRQGVAILVAACGHRREDVVRLRYREAWGTREAKYALLMSSSTALSPLQLVVPASPFYLFKPQSPSVREEFDRGVRITDVFVKGNVGIITARDNVVIDFDPVPLVERAQLFRESKLPDVELCAELGMTLKKGWNIRRARDQIKRDGDLNRFVRSLCYRPFDTRFIFYHPSLVWGMSYPTMQHMLSGKNLAMMVGRSGQVIGQGAWDILFCSRALTEFNLYRRGGHNLFPLYLFNDADEAQGTFGSDRVGRPNFSSGFLTSLSGALALDGKDEGAARESQEPEAIFGYIYAVLHSPNFRSRFAELLSIDFPRVPLPNGPSVFRALARLGGELVAMHLMESPMLHESISSYNGPKNPEVGRVGWSKDTVWLDAAATKKGQPATPGTIGFRGVPEAVWNFHIGGYQVCEKWLKDRKGRALSKEDLIHYQKIVVALSETIRLMKEIDEAIEAHGGWPDAFAVGDKAKAVSATKVVPFPTPEEIRETGRRPLRKAAEAKGKYTTRKKGK